MTQSDLVTVKLHMKRNLRGIQIKAKLAVATEYFNLMEAQLQGARCLETFLGAAEYDFTDDENQMEYSAMKQNIEADFTEEYYPFFRHSFLISLHSLAERCLENLCAEIANERSISISLAGSNPNSFDRAKLFLATNVQLRIQTLRSWKDVTDLELVRNCLVHAEVVISRLRKSGEKERLWNLVAKRTGLRLDARHAAISEFTPDKRPSEARIIADAGYCQHCLTKIECLFDGLFVKLGWS